MTKMTSAGLPAHEMTYRALKELLLFGEIAPGQAVTIQGLVARLEVGMTPVREALRRLISEGALEFQGNRRVSVPILTPENLSELKFARAMIERELTLKAFSNIDENGLKQLESLDSGLIRQSRAVISVHTCGTIMNSTKRSIHLRGHRS